MALTTVLLAAAVLTAAAKPIDASAENAAWFYADRSLRTRAYTLDRLASPAGATRCESLQLLGFRREPTSILSDVWYDASQILAETALLESKAQRDRCVLRKATAFLFRLERAEASGGFYPRANIDGKSPTTRDIYADDNALIGLALLEARDLSDSAEERAMLLRGARSAGRFLIESGLWDYTFGGGFWWNSNRGRMGEGKPTQATALAAQVFLRLYETTREPLYAAWAERSVAWLQVRLYEPAVGAYQYNLRHWDMPRQQGEYLDPRVFNYDQGIMIEVHLLYHRLVDPSGSHLGRAQELGRTLRWYLWDWDRGGYRLSTEGSSIYTAYSAWITQSLLALHAADGDPAWLRDAQANLDALETHLLDRAGGGYQLMQFRCQRRGELGCEQGDGWGLDRTKLLFSQAWMQRAQALMAARLAGVR